MATILLQLPTRSRPKKARATLDAFKALASGNHTILEHVVVDEDDAESRAEFPDATVIRRRSKIAACNTIPQLSLLWWNIVLLISDDMTPVLKNWDEAVVEEMKSAPTGCLHFDDGHTGPALCTLPIMAQRAFCDSAGRTIYNPEYLSLWADNEWTEVHEPKYVNQVLARHDHPHWGAGEQDALYRHNEALDAIDRKTYHRRKALGFPHPHSQPLLTVGICTLPERRELLTRLQLSLPRIGGVVEVITDSTPRPTTTGAKRQAILDHANGKYIMFVDDDDVLAPGAVGAITQRLASNDPEAIGFNGEMYTDGMNPEGFVIRHTDERFVWEKRDGVFHRGINHLSPVRIDLARRTGFKDITFAEDHDYAKRLHPLLSEKHCEYIDLPLYYYMFSTKKAKVVGELEGVVELSRDRSTKFVRIPRNMWSKGQRVQIAAVQGGVK